MLYYTIVMKNIKQAIEHKLTAYNPQDWLPIYQDGQWANKSSFVRYKARTALKRAVSAAGTTADFLDDMMDNARRL